MKITAAQLIKIADSGTIGRLGSQDAFTPRGALRIGRLIAALVPECTRIQKIRNAAFTDENSLPVNGHPGSRIAKPGCEEKIESSLTEMLSEEIDLDLKPLSLDDFKGGKLTPVDVMALGLLLVEN